MSIPNFSPSRQAVSAKEFKPLPNRVFVTEMDAGNKLTKGGLIIPDDNGKDRGIRPRWAKVYSIGDGVEDFKIGDWILIEHGRWSFKMTFEFEGATAPIDLWQVDYLGNCIIGVSEENPLT